MPSAASAFASAKYMLAPLQLTRAWQLPLERGLATSALLVFSAIHASGRRQTARVQGSITFLKLCGLLVFVLAGVSVGWRNSANLSDLRPVDGKLAVSLMSSMVYIYYAYTGWNSAAYLAGEIRHAQRLLPWAILLGTALVTLLYLALNVVYAFALSAADVRSIALNPANHAGRDAVAPIAQIAAVRLFGPGWSTIFSLAFGMMLLSTLSAYVLIGPRVVFAMARAGQFPSIGGRLTRGAGTPAVATALQAGVSLLLLWTGSFENLIIYAGVGLSIFSMLAVSSIFVLRRKRPEMSRPFRTPGYPATPAVFLVVTGALTIATASEHPLVSLYAILSILAGVPFYYLWRIGLRYTAAAIPQCD